MEEVSITWSTHTPNIQVLCSSKGFDFEISSSKKPPRELYRIILSVSNDGHYRPKHVVFLSKNITSN